jgi:CubicO group peptidase (beta-lactamase class C family)
MNVLDSEVTENRIPGAVFGIARHGKLAWLRAVGYREKASDDPLPADAIYALRSMTKPIVSLATMILVERGKLLLSDPVANYLPQFADMHVAIEKQDPRTGATEIALERASRPITIQDLLRHTAGMVSALSSGTALHQQYIEAGVEGEDQTLAERVEKLARLPLAYHPGTVWEYSMSVDVIGRVIEVISGMPLDRFVAANVTGPLKMTDTGYYVAEHDWGRIAQPMIDPATGQLPEHQDRRHPPKLISGNSGMVGTAGDYLRFCQMMLNGGTLDDVRVLGGGTVAHMSSDHLGPISHESESGRRLIGPGRGFGLGVAVRLTPGQHPMPGSVGDFDWGGAYATKFVIDPKQDLTAVLMINQRNYFDRSSRLFRTLVYQTIAN